MNKWVCKRAHNANRVLILLLSAYTSVDLETLFTFSVAYAKLKKDDDQLWAITYQKST